MPAHYCKVPGCPSSKEIDKNLSFFHFPKDRNKCIQWCQILNVAHNGSPEQELASSILCHTHFDVNQYTVVRKLKPDGQPQHQNANTNANVLNRPVLQSIQNENVSPSRKRLNDSSNLSEESVKAYLKEEMKKKDTKLSEQRETIKRVKLDNTQLLKEAEKNKTLTPELIRNHFKESVSLMNIIQMQVDRYSDKGGGHYSNIEKTIAITLFYSCGRHGYRTLENYGFKIPCLSTIRKWIAKLEIKPGRNQATLDCLKHKLSLMNDHERDCQLCLDETSIQEAVIYNKHTDSFEGYQDLGNGTELHPANHSLVLMLRGLNTNWKFYLYYYFSAGSTTSEDLNRIVKSCLDDVIPIGAKVRTLITDQGATNRGLAKVLGITPKDPWFEYVYHKIYFMYDTPHLIKCIRNCVKNNGFIETTDEEEYRISWDPIVEFYDRDKQSTSRSAPQLTDKHFNLSKNSTMKVGLAKQVIASFRTSAGMQMMLKNKEMVEEEGKQDKLSTALFIEKFARMFALLNISKPVVEGDSLKSGKKIFENRHMLMELFEWIGTLKSAKNWTPTLSGCQITLSAMYLLIGDLEKEGYKYVLTRRMQSDCIENLFSILKLKSLGKINAQQFRVNFRYVFVSNLIRSPEGSNCESYEEDETLLENLQKIDFLLKKSARKVNNDHPSLEDSNLTEDTSDNEFESECDSDSNDEDASFTEEHIFDDLKDFEFNKNSENAATLCAGWAVKKVAQKLRCNDCTNNLEFHMDREEPGLDADEGLQHLMAFDVRTFDRRQDFSYGHLLTQNVKLIFKRVSQYFCDNLRKSINPRGTNIMTNLLRHFRNDEIVSKWLFENEIPAACLKHRLQMLKLFLRAHIFTYIELRNSEQT